MCVWMFHSTRWFSTPRRWCRWCNCFIKRFIAAGFVCGWWLGWCHCSIYFASWLSDILVRCCTCIRKNMHACVTSKTTMQSSHISKLIRINFVIFFPFYLWYMQWRNKYCWHLGIHMFHLFTHSCWPRTRESPLSNMKTTYNMIILWYSCSCWNVLRSKVSFDMHSLPHHWCTQAKLGVLKTKTPQDSPPMTLNFWTLLIRQCAKKVVSDSLGLVDFSIRLVNSVFNLLDGQVMIFREFE